jgi:hypothetical protein
MQDAEKLNEAQQRHLYASCHYIDGLLCDLEQAFHQEDSLSPFPHYVIDLTPAEMKQFEEHICRIREQLLRALAWQDLKPEAPAIPLTRAVRTSLTFIDVTIEELSPRYMRGCGTVPEGSIAGLNEVIHDLRSAARDTERYLQNGVVARETEKRGE